MGLCQNCHLSPILLNIFIDILSKHSQGVEVVLVITAQSLIFVDDVGFIMPEATTLTRLVHCKVGNHWDQNSKS